MATQVQFRGGTTTEHTSFTGAAREVTVDTTKDTVVVHDGSTAGGFPLLRASGGAQDISTTGDVSAADGTFTGDATLTGDLTINTDAFFVDASETKVGIGTTSPQTITHILGVDPILRIQDNSTPIADAFAAIQLGESGANEALGNYWQIAMEGDSGTSTDHLTFKDGAGERMRIDSDGNLGIGTDSPSGLLHISGDTCQLHFTDEDDSSSSRIYQSGATFAIDVDQADAKASSVIAFKVDDAEAMRIDSSGDATFVGDVKAGERDPTATDTRGVRIAVDSSNGGCYVQAKSSATSSAVMAFQALHGTTENFKVMFNGNVTAAGALSKGSGSFKIDHPIPDKKDTHHLVHSFIEGPQADLIYSGMVTLVSGKAEINLDTAARMTEGTFLLLNTNLRRFVSNEGGWTAVKSSITGNVLTVEAQDDTCTDEVFWTVIGERKDQHMLDTEWTDENGRVITEPLKSVEED